MRTPTTILAGLATLGLSLAVSATAQASVTYGPAASFGAGKVVHPLGVAVDQASNDVYVASFLSPQPLDKFDFSGNILSPPSPFGSGKPAFGNEELFSGVAVDPVNGHLYAVDGFGQEIQTYDGSTGALLSHFSVAGSANLAEIATAVQIASDPAGDIYFPNALSNEVQVFSSAGSVLRTIAGLGAEALKEPTGVALDAAGNVYVADNGNGRMEELSPTGAFIVAIGAGVDKSTGGSVCTAASGDTCGPGSDGAQAVAVDGSGEVFIGENNGSGFHVVLYSPAGEKLADFGTGTIGTSPFGAIDTLAVGPTGLVYVTDGANNVVWIYAKQSKPSLVNVSSSAVRQTSATLDATINPNYADTTYRFEYGASAAYGASVPAPDADIGNGLASGVVVVGQELSSLQPGTTYHYRVVATNALGQTAGADQTFATPPPQPPVVSTGQATGVAQNSATLTGTIDTQGFETTYEFDLGTDTSYGTRIFGDAGSLPGALPFTAGLQGLAPGTTYHYRIAASNIFGTTYGIDRTFTTASYPSATLTAPGTLALLPAPLIATASASGASARLAAHAARHGTARKSNSRPSGHRRKARWSGRTGHAHANARGK